MAETLGLTVVIETEQLSSRLGKELKKRIQVDLKFLGLYRLLFQFDFGALPSGIKDLKMDNWSTT